MSLSSGMSVPKRGTTPQMPFWGPSPGVCVCGGGGSPPSFSRAGERDSATQPPRLSPFPAKSRSSQAFKSEKISLNAERGVSLIRRGTAEAPRQARWVPRARPGWDHAGFAPRCRFSFPRSPADVPVAEKGLGGERSSPGTGMLHGQLKSHSDFFSLPRRNVSGSGGGGGWVWGGFSLILLPGVVVARGA